MIVIIADVDEVAALLDIDEARQPEIVRPQTSGPCVHYDDQHPDEPCAYPYPHEDGCPHLDNPDIICPVKDACYATSEVARMRDVCEAEQDEQDADMTAVAPSQTYKTAAPEFVEPEPEEAPVYTTPARPTGRAPVHVKEWTLAEDAAIRDATTAAESVTLYRSAIPDSGRSDGAIRMRWYRKIRPGLCEAPDPDAIRVIQIPPQAKRKDAWSEDELWVVARATTLPDAIGAYRAAYPDSTRTDGAIKAQWRKLRGPDRETSPVTATPAPDFIGDLTPVTQCEEPPEGITYGDPPEHPPETEVAAAFDKEDLTRHPWIGMRVRILDPPDLLNKTGVVHRYNSDPREMLVALDDAPDRIWCPPESLLLIGAGRRSP